MKKTTILFIITLLYVSNLDAQWSNGQNASFVVGQSDFVSNSASVSSTELSTPYDVAIDTDYGKMYIVDLGNHRVLRFSYPITANLPVAELVFGQEDFVSNGVNRGGAIAANTLSNPTAVIVRNNTLWICDQDNNRILKFNNASTISSNGPDANGVLGSSTFTTRTIGVNQSSLSMPYDIAIDNDGNLWVVEMGSNRVLRFTDAANKSNGANADQVLGQTLYTTSTSATSQSGMSLPSGVFCSGTTLFVADMNNNRVLRFDNAASKSNGSNADGVLGQVDFTSNISNRDGDVAANTMSGPVRVEADNSGRLYVADQGNNRYLIFNNAASKADGANAENELGQPDFLLSSPGLSASALNFPQGSAVDNTNNCLLVVDEQNNRVLQFDAESALPVELTKFDAVIKSNIAILMWKTENEVNNYGFEVERRELQNAEWRNIGFIQGAGTSNAPKEYSYSDATCSGGNYVYRLKQINTDGTFKYSQSVEVSMQTPNQFALVQNYPNPFNPATTIEFTLAEDAFTTLKVCDIIGREVVTLINKNLQAGVLHQAVFNANGLSSGMYFYRLESGKQMQVKKFILLK